MANLSKLAGMTGKVEHNKMRQQLRGMVRQGGFKPSGLPQTVVEDGEYDDQPGGARLNGALISTNSDQQQGRGSSDLNPTSSPWVPNTQEIKAEHTEVVSHAAYNGQIMSGLQFVPGHWAAPTGVTHVGTSQSDSASLNAGTNRQHLSGSVSMGNLTHQTPVRQINGGGFSHSQGGSGTTIHGGVPSPGSDTPKAGNIGLMTEPRNFAPGATINVADLGAPPKFDLNKVTSGTSITTADSQDPFVTQASQGGPIQMPLFGSQVDTTHLLATGKIPFGPATGETLNFDDLPHDDQSGGTQGVEAQPFAGHGLQIHNAQNVQGVPIQQHSANGTGIFMAQQGALQPYAGHNGAVVPYPGSYPGSYPPQTAIAPYCAPVPEYIRTQRSPELNRLTAGPTGLPSANAALNQANFPFIEPATRQGNVLVRGVVKIGNIPFVTNRAEIIAVLGRNSRILNDTEEPVHIIMERVTGKTTDAYVEFHTLEDATKAVEKHQLNISRGRVTRIGQRPVEIELSSQSALMKDLYPSARGVFWNGGNPQVLPHNPEEPWENFKGFISNEEMTMLIKHVEVPHRSPFSKECPQRPFECLISTLTKFPWHMKAYITVQQRHAMHKATCDLLRILVGSIRDHRDELNLTPRLLKRVVAAAMRCDGFSTAQKDDVAYLVDMGEMEQRAFGQPRFADSWRHLYVLVPKTGVPLDVIEWYVAIIREETSRFLETQSFQEKCQTHAIGDATDGYFGYFWRELNHPVGPVFDSMNLSQLAMHEYQTIESIIRRALTTTTPMITAH